MRSSVYHFEFFQLILCSDFGFPRQFLLKWSLIIGDQMRYRHNIFFPQSSVTQAPVALLEAISGLMSHTLGRITEVFLRVNKFFQTHSHSESLPGLNTTFSFCQHACDISRLQKRCFVSCAPLTLTNCLVLELLSTEKSERLNASQELCPQRPCAVDLGTTTFTDWCHALSIRRPWESKTCWFWLQVQSLLSSSIRFCLSVSQDMSAPAYDSYIHVFVS